MNATFIEAQAAAMSYRHASERAPFSMPAMCMYMSATASAIIIGTGVITSVLFFVPVFALTPILLPGLIVLLITLLLICLTGLVRLEGLVGRKRELIASTAQGD